jgi:putative flippase GtrA
MMLNSFSRYIFLGLTNTLFGYVVFIILFSLMEDAFEVGVIFTLSALISISESFYVQKRFVWRSSNNWRGEAKRFILTFTVVYFLNIAALNFASRVTDLDLRLVQLPILGALAIGLYFVHKNWTFHEKN